MKKSNKKSFLLIGGILIWLILSAITYSLNGYIGIIVILTGAVVFFLYRRSQRKEVEKAAPAGGLYAGLQHGVVYLTASSIAACKDAFSKKEENDPLEYDFSWNEEEKSGSLALYCKKGGLRPSNFPSSFVVSFSERDNGVWILVRYLDPNAKTSIMNRIDVDGFLEHKCKAKPIGMRKPPQEETE